MDVPERFERAMGDPFWLPPWAHAVDRPEIAYTWSARPLSVYNSVTRVRAAADRLPALVDEVSSAHRGVNSRWVLADGSRHPALPALLQAGGWEKEHEHVLRVVEAATSVDVPDGIEVVAVSDERTLRDAIRTTQRAFGNPEVPPGADRVADELRACAVPGARVRRFVAYAGGEPVAYGGLNLFPDLGVGFLWGGGTVPEHRGRGAYRSVLAARLRCAEAAGIGIVGLYARVETSDPIVARLGFAARGTAVAWERSAG